MAALSGTLTLPDYNSVSTEIPKLDSGALDTSILGGDDTTGLADLAPDVGGGTAPAPSNDGTVFGVQQAEIASRRAAIQDAINRIQARNSQPTDIEQQPLGLLSIIANRDPNHNVTADIMAQDHMLSGIKQERMAKSDDANLQGALLQNQFLGQDQENYLKKQQIDAMAMWRQAQMSALQMKMSAMNGTGPNAAPIIPEEIVNSDKSAEEKLGTIEDQNIRNQALSYYNGLTPPPNITSRTPSYVVKAWQAAQAVDPTISPTTYATRKAVATAFAHGPEATNVNYINTAINHLGHYAENIGGLDNTGFTPINAISNAVEAPLSDTFNTKMTALKDDSTALGSETAKSYKGAGSTSEGEMKDWQNQLSTSLGPLAGQGTAKEIGTLMVGKVKAMNDQYRAAYPNSNKTFVSPESMAALKKLGVDTSSIEGTPYTPGASHTGNIDADTAPTALPQFKSKADPEFIALPSGAQFLDSNGVTRVKH